jgi:hypothetical protein
MGFGAALSYPENGLANADWSSDGNRGQTFSVRRETGGR